MLNTFAHFMTFQARQTVIALPTALAEPTPCAKTVRKPQNKHLHVLRYMMDSWFGAVLGGGVYGAWAVWANWSQGANTAWGIGAAHWLTSALLTFFGTLAMRQFYGRGQPQMWGWAGCLRAFAGGLCLTYASLLAVHGVLGTQHLLLTLAPGIVPNILFCASYALLLKRTMTVTTP